MILVVFGRGYSPYMKEWIVENFPFLMGVFAYIKNLPAFWFPSIYSFSYIYREGKKIAEEEFEEK